MDQTKSSWRSKKRVWSRNMKIPLRELSVFNMAISWSSTTSGYIDIGDGCWSRNVLATTLRYWWRFWPFSSTRTSNNQRPKIPSIFNFLNQHSKIVTNIWKLSPTSTCHQHLCHYYRNFARKVYLGWWATSSQFDQFQISIRLSNFSIFSAAFCQQLMSKKYSNIRGRCYDEVFAFQLLTMDIIVNIQTTL